MMVVGWLSVHRWDLLGPVHYVGLDNWRSVLTDPSFAKSLVVTALFIVIVVPTQSLLATGDRRALAVDTGPDRRRRQHAAGSAHRVADRPGPGATRGLGGDDLDERRVRGAVLRRGHPRNPHRYPGRGAHRRCERMAAVSPNHLADAEADAVLRSGHGCHQ